MKTENGKGILKIPKEVYASKGSLFGPDFMIRISGYDMKVDASSDDGQYWIFGDQFMKQYFTIFDYENKKVGFIRSNPKAGQSDS